MTAVKICGLSTQPAIQSAIDFGADYVGFVHFPRSPRHIGFEQAASLKALLPESIKSVTVLVDPDDATLAQATSILAPDYIQLHGKETPQRVQDIRQRFGTKIIKAFSVRHDDDISQSRNFYTVCDMLMFDAKAPETALLPGGNGLSFDWALLKDRSFPLPWFLSGGLNVDNVAAAIGQTGATLVDVSSGIERAPGVKDSALIEQFIKAARI
jgi:phosphoribosylanthranilate isomerase